MLTVNQLSFGFSAKQIFEKVSFSLPPGAISVLLGGNGAGKTTLFNLIAGFLKPSVGSIYYGAVELTHCEPFEIAQLGIARTFQDLRLISRLSVRENIVLSVPKNPGERIRRALLPRFFVRDFESTCLRKSVNLLEDYVLSDICNELAGNISYGQQKLLTLACCEAMDPNIFLLDEPVAGISPENRNLIATKVRKLRDVGKTIFVIEHQPDFIKTIGDNFLVLSGGNIQQFDTFEDCKAIIGF